MKIGNLVNFLELDALSFVGNEKLGIDVTNLF